VLDIAPYYLTALVSLLGPIAAVAAFSSLPTPERVLGTGPRAGATIAVEVPTHAAALLRTAEGAIASLTVSFEARGQYLSGLQVHGTEGSLRLPDANAFGGELWLERGGGEPQLVEVESFGDRETRGLGVDDLATALHEGRAHRASGELALHVLTAAEAIVLAAETSSTIEL
jgi:predicted dehydrogenase